MTRRVLVVCGAPIVALAALMAGCVSQPEVTETRQAVFTPCQVDVPERPLFPADSLTGDEDIFTLGTTLWADRKERRAYELKLEVRLQGCVAQPP